MVAFDDILDLARKSGVNVYAIGLQSKESANTGKHRYFPAPLSAVRAGSGQRSALAPSGKRFETTL